MNLPEMLREQNPTIEVFNDGWAVRRENKWKLIGVGIELAALVEAADALGGWSHGQGCEALDHLLAAYDAARAALVAKIGGKE